ncbi:protein WFDC9-like [Herpailurus yagouaroundi]|uniref:protein WFDC9-like n=1 Tax=Herpailurus yagouaroundi TaxID=1608482 RepID=UPI001AD6E5C4|nr:protein WFDC9-like [Puma yagouaroundi]
MKGLFLQMFTLYCVLIIMSVAGTLREKSETQSPYSVIVELKPRHCPRLPSNYECGRRCKYAWQCGVGYECCYSLCGPICMNVRKHEADTEDYTPVTTTTTPGFTFSMTTTLTG